MVRDMQFRDLDLRDFWINPAAGHFQRIPTGVERALFRKLQMLSAAHSLQDLRILRAIDSKSYTVRERGSIALG